MVYPIQRVNVDFTAPMLGELDDAAEELNISRQAVIKTLVRERVGQTISTSHKSREDGSEKSSKGAVVGLLPVESRECVSLS